MFIFFTFFRYGLLGLWTDRFITELPSPTTSLAVAHGNWLIFTIGNEVPREAATMRVVCMEVCHRCPYSVRAWVEDLVGSHLSTVRIYSVQHAVSPCQPWHWVPDRSEGAARPSRGINQGDWSELWPFRQMPWRLQRYLVWRKNQRQKLICIRCSFEQCGRRQMKAAYKATVWERSPNQHLKKEQQGTVRQRDS